jgi:hypothetical protein
MIDHIEYQDMKMKREIKMDCVDYFKYMESIMYGTEGVNEIPEFNINGVGIGEIKSVSCPTCGMEFRSLEIGRDVCPYCGREIYDY